MRGGAPQAWARGHSPPVSRGSDRPAWLARRCWPLHWCSVGLPSLFPGHGGLPLLVADPVRAASVGWVVDARLLRRVAELAPPGSRVEVVVLEGQGVGCFQVVPYRPPAYPAWKAERTLPCDELAVRPPRSLALAHPSSYRQAPPLYMAQHLRRGGRIDVPPTGRNGP